MPKSKDLSIGIPNTWVIGRNHRGTKASQELQHWQLRRPSQTKLKSKYISHRIYRAVSHTTASVPESVQESRLPAGGSTTPCDLGKTAPSCGCSHSYLAAHSTPFSFSSMPLPAKSAVCIGSPPAHHFRCHKVVSSRLCNSIKGKVCTERQGNFGLKGGAASELCSCNFRKSALEGFSSRPQPYNSTSHCQVPLEAGPAPVTSSFLVGAPLPRRAVVASPESPCLKQRPTARRGEESAVMLKRGRRLRHQKWPGKGPRHDLTGHGSGDEGNGPTKVFSTISHCPTLAVSSTSDSASRSHGVSSDTGRSEISAGPPAAPPGDREPLGESLNFASSKILSPKRNENEETTAGKRGVVNLSAIWMKCKSGDISTVSSSSENTHPFESGRESGQRKFQMRETATRGDLRSPTGAGVPLSNRFMASSSPSEGFDDADLQALPQSLMASEMITMGSSGIEKAKSSIELPAKDSDFQKNDLLSTNADLKEVQHPNRRLPNGRVLHNGPHENLFIALPCSLNISCDSNTETPLCERLLKRKHHYLLSRSHAHASTDGTDARDVSAYSSDIVGSSSMTPSCALSEDSKLNKSNTASSGNFIHYNHNSSGVMNCKNRPSNELLHSPMVNRKLESFTAAEVIPGLFLGAASDAANLEALSYHKISLIINITHECAVDPEIQYEKYGIRVLRFPLADHSDERISPLFFPLARIIHEQLHRREEFLAYQAAKARPQSETEACPCRTSFALGDVPAPTRGSSRGPATPLVEEAPAPSVGGASEAIDPPCEGGLPTGAGAPPLGGCLGHTSDKGAASCAWKGGPSSTPSGGLMGAAAWSHPALVTNLLSSLGGVGSEAKGTHSEAAPRPTEGGLPFYGELDERDCGGVLVHCRMGVSRSASILLAYLILYGPMVVPLSGEGAGATLSSPLREDFIRGLFIEGIRRERQLTESVGGIVVTVPCGGGSGGGPSSAPLGASSVLGSLSSPVGGLQLPAASETGEALTPRTLAALSCWPCFQRRLRAHECSMRRGRRGVAPPPHNGRSIPSTSNPCNSSTSSVSDASASFAWSPLFSVAFAHRLRRSTAEGSPSRGAWATGKGSTIRSSPLYKTANGPAAQTADAEEEEKERTKEVSNDGRTEAKRRAGKGSDRGAVVEDAAPQREAPNAPNNEDGHFTEEESTPTCRPSSGSIVAEHFSASTGSSGAVKCSSSVALRVVPGAHSYSIPSHSTREALISGWEAQPCMTYQEAFDFLKLKKREVSPNIGFVLALRELAGGGDFSFSSSL